jgi:fatty-acyl-CoA synthase
VEGTAEPLVVPVADTGQAADPYEQLLLSGTGAADPLPVRDEEDVISINYTSGTTGRPKGVMVTHRGAFLNALGEVIEAGLTYDSVYLWTLPMFHCNGWGYAWGVTAVAGRHVCLRKFEPNRVWDLLEHEGVTHFCCAPTVAIALVNDPTARRVDHPVTVPMGGAPPSPTLIERMTELNLRPIHLFGLTETYGPMTVCAWHREWDDLPPAAQARLIARQGWPLLTHEPVRVVDERLEDVPRDGSTIGEVVMRGNNVMKGY